MDKTTRFYLIVSVLVLVAVACLISAPQAAAPGSLEAQIAEGDIRFEGTGNVNNPGIGCQDPTAAVSVYVAPKTKELNGTTFSVYVNSVTLDAITDGVMVKLEECEKTGQGENYGFGAKGIYYANEGKIIFTTCGAGYKYEADGNAFLVGEGFEGEYACLDNGVVFYEVAFSAYEVSQ